ncbi:MAG: pilus assembly protein CpaE [Anaerolineae bacterium]|nr:pilus assembly protein CpaE [Anaerolineae bacterium]
MLSLSLAKKLKTAGLNWTPAKNDLFAIPDRGLDDTVFVISDMTILVREMSGHLAVQFHGAAEWALDHILVTEVVWLPTEGQLRELLEQRLIGEPEPILSLISTTDGYRCQIQFHGNTLTFEAFGASEAYGLALLHILEEAGKENLAHV